ncbi:DUF4920 domain-containing protein [Maribacter sp. HTCC2170]|uniref:DUF4920 domain-containing protein n=1 Tax=Maribacter sp. (strain HTCC2170 / KCCM 42371) TaxID=313603 RepID=UPI0005A13732|nr:DUF4920 domain-containing protein [Maribacter sp. HTCC2170]
MKGFNILVVLLLLIFSCKGQETKQEVAENPENMGQLVSFGEKILDDGSISNLEMMKKYGEMVVADTVQVKFSGVVKDVCQAKGCWMKVELEGGEEAMVKFKDYGFFMPKDIAGKEVIVNGYAFVEEMSVEDQKHYAEDGGKSAEEIAKITEPKKTFGFEADGVLLKE